MTTTTAPDPIRSPAPLPGDRDPGIAVRLTGVSVKFDDVTALQEIDLEVKRGEFVALIGPSGGGKSTLLRVIAGLLPATAGRAEISGQPALVFQDYRLLPWRTVLRNVALPRELTGRGQDARQMLEQVGMAEHAARHPQTLSGGMQARVAIARALAQDAEVLLMDEPFAALDALVRERFNLELRRLHHKDKRTILFVTHSIREAVYLADKVVVLRDGRVFDVMDTRNEGRLTAYTDGPEATLRDQIGLADSSILPRPRRTPRRVPWELFGTVGLLLLLLVGWNVLAAQLSPLFFPAPADVWAALVENAPTLARQAWATLSVTLLGVAISLLLGTPIGYAMGRSRALERLFSPFIVALQAVPTVIIAPLLITWLDYGLASRLTVTTLIAIFPVIVSTTIGVREVGRVYREVFRTMGAPAWKTFFKLELPGALPSLLGGLRLTVTLALIGTVVGEFVFQGPGLGAFVNSERLNFHVANAVAAVGVIVVLGLLFYGVVDGLERVLLRYRQKET